MNPARKLELKDDAEAFEQKRLSKPFSVKATDDVGTIEGHGAVFDDPHPTSSWALGFDWKDVIRPGAFSKTLAEHKKLGTTPLMLFMHERGNVIGAWREVAEDGDGLFVKGQVHLAAKTPASVPIYELLKMGAMTGLSIGFRVSKHTLDEEQKVREILAVELAEISPVDIPAGPKARITDVKADPRNIRSLEKVLRDAGLTSNEAKALLAKGFPALQREAAATDEPSQREADGPGDEAAALLKSMRDFAANHKF